MRLALVGALWALVLTPPMESVWVYDPPDTDWPGMRWVPRTFGPTLESWGALSFGRPDLGPYEVYGKGFFVVYLAMMPLTLAVHRRYVASGGEARLERWTWRALWWGLLCAALGDFISYWGMSAPGTVGTVLWSNGFAIEVLAILLLLLPGMTGYAVGLLVWPHLPWWSGLMLLTWIPVSVLILVYVSEYVPNAVVAPLAIIWALIGLWMAGSARSVRPLLTEPNRDTRQQRPSSPLARRHRESASTDPR